ATARPAAASCSATSSPPGPMPITITSSFSVTVALPVDFRSKKGGRHFSSARATVVDVFFQIGLARHASVTPPLVSSTQHRAGADEGEHHRNAAGCVQH